MLADQFDVYVPSMVVHCAQIGGCKRQEEALIFFLSEKVECSWPTFAKFNINTRRSDIHSYYTRGSTNLFIDKIRLEVAKRAFYYKGGIIFNS